MQRCCINMPRTWSIMRGGCLSQKDTQVSSLLRQDARRLPTDCRTISAIVTGASTHNVHACWVLVTCVVTAFAVRTAAPAPARRQQLPVSASQRSDGPQNEGKRDLLKRHVAV